MTAFATTSRGGGIHNFHSGSFTSDGNVGTITLGFTPRWFKVINSTDTIVWEKIEGMAAANCVKTVTGGTTTIDTGSAILFNTDRTVTLSTTLCGTSKAIAWVAEG